MALCNYLINGTYLRIDTISVERKNKRVSSILALYSSSSAAFKLETPFILNFVVDGNANIPAVESLTAVESLKKSHNYLKQEDEATFFLAWNLVSGTWDKHLINNGFVTYVEDVEAYYRYSGKTWELVDITSDYRIWEKYFENAVNATEAMYLFLLTLTRFKECVSG